MSLRPAPLAIAAGAAVGAGALGAVTSKLGAGPFAQATVAIAGYVLLIGLFARPSIAELVGESDHGSAEELEFADGVGPSPEEIELRAPSPAAFAGPTDPAGAAVKRPIGAGSGGPR